MVQITQPSWFGVETSTEAVPCCAMPCCATLHTAKPRHAVPTHAMSWEMPCHTVARRAVPGRVAAENQTTRSQAALQQQYEERQRESEHVYELLENKIQLLQEVSQGMVGAREEPGAGAWGLTLLPCRRPGWHGVRPSRPQHWPELRLRNAGS